MSSRVGKRVHVHSPPPRHAPLLTAPATPPAPKEAKALKTSRSVLGAAACRKYVRADAGLGGSRIGGCGGGGGG